MENGKQLGNFSKKKKIKQILTIWPSNFAPKIIPKGTENTGR